MLKKICPFCTELILNYGPELKVKCLKCETVVNFIDSCEEVLVDKTELGEQSAWD